MEKESTREEETPPAANTGGDGAAAARHDATEGTPEPQWVTTEVAAAALGVSPRTIRGYIQDEQLKAKSEGEGVTKRWLVSSDGVQELRKKRRASRDTLRSRRSAAAQAFSAAEVSADFAAELLGAIQELQYWLGHAEARMELAERAEGGLRAERGQLVEDLKRERERAEQLEREKLEALRIVEQLAQERDEAQEKARRLQEELEIERGKGFFRRLFGG
ncbi:MAG: hypothetical protein QOI57_614 [Rubrobacteraceae bacterium]|nr:hypothetical protein [Rubrobacteraceae bacterium]